MKRITKAINNHPKTLLTILLCLIVFSYLTLLLDTLKYPGFVGSHFILDAKVYSTASIVFILLFINKLPKWFEKINLFALIILVFGYLVLSYLEAVNYVNFVLTKYRFSLAGFIYIPLFSLLVFVALKKEIRNSIRIKGIWPGVLMFFVVYAIYVNLGKSFNNATYSNLYVISHVGNSHDEKMHYQWGDFYDYMVFVENNTPADANIIIPPHIAPWLNRSGDRNLVRSFLYPRNLIQYETETIPLDTLPKGTYVLVAWGEWECHIEGMCRGWPVEELSADEFVIKHSTSSETKEVRKDIIYDPTDTSNPYGLIKL